MGINGYVLVIKTSNAKLKSTNATVADKFEVPFVENLLANGVVAVENTMLSSRFAS